MIGSEISETRMLLKGQIFSFFFPDVMIGSEISETKMLLKGLIFRVFSDDMIG